LAIEAAACGSFKTLMIGSSEGGCASGSGPGLG
jgi:hypothetical protein